MHAPNVSAVKTMTVATPTSTGIAMEHGTINNNGVDRARRGKVCINVCVHHAEFAGPTINRHTNTPTISAPESLSKVLDAHIATNPINHVNISGHPNNHDRRRRLGSGCGSRKLDGVTTPHSVHGAPSATRSRLWPHSAQRIVMMVARALSLDA